MPKSITLFDFFSQNNYRSIREKIESHLNNSDLLKLRAVHPTLRDALRLQAIPFRSSFHFKIAIVKLLDETQRTIDQDFLKKLYDEVYECNVRDPSDRPALLYRLDDMQKFKYGNTKLTFSPEFLAFLNGENIDVTTRIYSSGPFVHSWLTNVIWVCAQISIRRPFYVYSEINNTNFRRSTDPNIYSAFAREITCALKANYEIKFFENNNGELKLMLFPTSETPDQIDIVALNPTDVEIRDAYNKMKSFSDGLDYGLKILKHCDNFNKCNDISELEAFKKTPLLEEIKNQLLVTPKLDYFIKGMTNLFEKIGCIEHFDLNSKLCPPEASDNIEKGIFNMLDLIKDAMKKEAQEIQQPRL